MSDYKIFVGTGWWCNEDSSKHKTYGDDFIRSSDFHKIWFELVQKYLQPEQIVMVDSNSPVQPKNLCSKITKISLNENGGHASNHIGKYSGWTRSVLLSMEVASHSDCDFYIYVEQDVLLRGPFREQFCAVKPKKYSFGREYDLPNPLQQSLFCVRREAIEPFLIRYRSISYTDYQIVPEIKFALCVSPLFRFIPKFIFRRLGPKKGRYLRRVQSHIAKIMMGDCFHDFGFGRSRPLKFSDEPMYFQHGSRTEIEEFMSYENSKPQ